MKLFDMGATLILVIIVTALVAGHVVVAPLVKAHYAGDDCNWVNCKAK